MKREGNFWDVLIGIGEPFGAKRRSLAAVTLAVGILTFFVPLITTNPPVQDRGRWSVFDLVQHVWDRELPPGPNWHLAVVHFPIDCLLLYFSLLVAVALLRFPRLQDKLVLTALLSIYLDVAMWQWQKEDFEVMFYGHVSYDNVHLAQSVGVGELVFAQLVVWGAVLFIATKKELDGEPAVKSIQQVAKPSKAEPEFLEAEILPPQEQKAKPTDRRPPRLRD